MEGKHTLRRIFEKEQLDVAKGMRRKAIGIDLNGEYHAMAVTRIAQGVLAL